MKPGDLISLRSDPTSPHGLVIEVVGPYFRVLWWNGNVNCPGTSYMNGFFVVAQGTK